MLALVIMLRHVYPTDASLELTLRCNQKSWINPTPQYETWAIVVEVPAVLSGLFLLRITSINVPQHTFATD